jgi:hypothetical protein
MLRPRPATLGGFRVKVRSATLPRSWDFQQSLRLRTEAALQCRKEIRKIKNL